MKWFWICFKTESPKKSLTSLQLQSTIFSSDILHSFSTNANKHSGDHLILTWLVSLAKSKKWFSFFNRLNCSATAGYITVRMWIDQKTADSLNLCSTSSLSSTTMWKQQFKTKQQADYCLIQIGAFSGEGRHFWWQLKDLKPNPLQVGVIMKFMFFRLFLWSCLWSCHLKLAVVVCDFRDTFYSQS